MFFAPICNSCLRNVNLKQMRAIVGLIVILNVFSGFVLGYNANSSGYSVIHLIMIYLIGIVTLLNKTERRKADINIKYSGFNLLCYICCCQRLPMFRICKNYPWEWNVSL